MASPFPAILSDEAEARVLTPQGSQVFPGKGGL
jgi:hypothetical protein